MTAKGRHPSPGAGNIYAKANELIIKITGKIRDNRSKSSKKIVSPGFQSRAHYHIKAFETFHVFDGAAEFKVGGEVYQATPGSYVHIPPGVPHPVTSPPGGVRMLMIYSPAGTEGMFAAMHALTQDELMDANLTKALALRDDTVMVEPATDGRGKGTILG